MAFLVSTTAGQAKTTAQIYVADYLRKPANAQRALSADVCHWHEVERGCRADVRRIREEAAIGGVIDMEEMHDAEVCVRTARSNASSALKVLASIKLEPLACTKALSAMGECIANDAACQTIEQADAAKFIMYLTVDSGDDE